MAAKVGTFQVWSRRRRTDGVRILAARSKPMYTTNSEAREQFDAWVPLLAPGKALFDWINRPTVRPGDWKKFVRRYKKEMLRPQSRDLINMLAQVSKKTPISVGCHCHDEDRCHRTILKVLIERAARRRR